ncbi:MAG: hypothetical protein M1840_002273 [Geoglossum simile]|nr:MAG: hypothetical protein M1840_002273 [Geoglossum simile]
MAMSPPSKAPRAKTRFSTRTIKSNPLLHSTDHDRERRRNLFLRKVREEGQDRKWKARGGDDEVMRSIYISEQKRWEAKQARIAREILASQEEEEDILVVDSGNTEDARIIDDLLDEENAELEALVSLWESPQSVNNGNSTPAPTSILPNSGSDDEEYDQLFLDLVNQEYNGQDQENFGAESGIMDTSSG